MNQRLADAVDGGDATKSLACCMRCFDFVSPANLYLSGVGSSLGAWAGSVYSSRLFSTFGTSGLLLVAVGLLVACVGIHRTLRRFPKAFRKDGQAIGQEPLNKQGAFRLEKAPTAQERFLYRSP